METERCITRCERGGAWRGKVGRGRDNFALRSKTEASWKHVRGETKCHKRAKTNADYPPHPFLPSVRLPLYSLLFAVHAYTSPRIRCSHRPVTRCPSGRRIRGHPAIRPLFIASSSPRPLPSSLPLHAPCNSPPSCPCGAQSFCTPRSSPQESTPF